jgi:thiamine pyrophosphate-dependent acetolactate synthase large subunit-like protein
MRLADHIGAVLLTTLPARGLFHQSAHSLNVVGGFASDTAREACLDADLIIAVGLVWHRIQPMLASFTQMRKFCISIPNR